MRVRNELCVYKRVVLDTRFHTTYAKTLEGNLTGRRPCMRDCIQPLYSPLVLGAVIVSTRRHRVSAYPTIIHLNLNWPVRRLMLPGFVIPLLCLLAQVATLCPPFLKTQSACSCFAYIDGIVIKCNGPEGPGVVEELKKNPLEIRELALENANIVEIGRHAFRNLRIKKLILDNNRIRALHPDAFRGLESVMLELSISMNKLTAVPTDSLIAMRALNVLSLRCNNIGDIKTPVFRNLSSLIDLNLGCNQVRLCA
uniref:Uncharacterized protein n=1 Tax=Parascaris univalens TaxID=6257 RepID=A0A915A8J2_PARUN